ncbi:MAG: radical SAM protein [Firmicutes bacterium]|nr:radical SAM protein [Bacillota bacterium]
MCYESDNEQQRAGKHGDIEVLKQIVSNAVANGITESFILVGGDPCAHPQLLDLLKHIKQVGAKAKVETYTAVLSNTHEYKDNGKPVSIKEVAPYVDEMNVTLHGATAEVHDAFNGVKGSYKAVTTNVKEFQRVKDDAEVGVTINVMPHTANEMNSIMFNAMNEFDNKVNMFCIQRIMPAGRACGSVDFQIERIDANNIMAVFNEMQKEYGQKIDLCDVFPYCAIKPMYHHLLPKGGCNWGKDNVSVKPDGSIVRCGTGGNALSKNMLELDTYEKFMDFWDNDKELAAFKKMHHLDEACKNCLLLKDCGGGCLHSNKLGDPFKTGHPTGKSKDYLSEV